MEAFLRQRLSDRRFATPLQGRRSEAELYAGCLPQAASTGTHPLSQVRVEASAKKKHCWEGYERTPGTVAGTDGSCRKKGSGKKKKKEKKAKKDGDASSSSSSDDDDEHHKKKKAKKD